MLKRETRQVRPVTDQSQQHSNEWARLATCMRRSSTLRLNEQLLARHATRHGYVPPPLCSKLLYLWYYSSFFRCLNIPVIFRDRAIEQWALTPYYMDTVHLSRAKQQRRG